MEWYPGVDGYISTSCVLSLFVYSADVLHWMCCRAFMGMHVLMRSTSPSYNGTSNVKVASIRQAGGRRSASL